MNIENFNQAGFYLKLSLKLILMPRLRLFVIIPFILNCLIFSLGFYYFIGVYNDLKAEYLNVIPSYLSFISGILFVAFILILLFIFLMIFSVVGSFICAPFNGILAEKVEEVLTKQPASPTNFADLIKDVPRILYRELQKILYVFPRFLLLLIISLIPMVNIISPVLFFLFNSYTLALNYCDYPFDNHKIPFKTMRVEIWRYKELNTIFGAVIGIFSLIPIINFMIIPVAVCGATAIWVDKYSHLKNNM